MIKRFLNALGLATKTELNAAQKTIEEILTYHRNQKTYLEHKFAALESSIETKPDRSIVEGRLDALEDMDFAGDIESIESRLDDLEDDSHEPLTKNSFNIDDYFDIDAYQSEIDTMINNEIDYSHSFADSSDVDEAIEKALEEFKDKNYEDPDVSMEQIVTAVIEQIGGAILGLNHTEPEPPKPSTEYIDPVLQEIILNDPLLTILDED